MTQVQLLGKGNLQIENQRTKDIPAPADVQVPAPQMPNPFIIPLLIKEERTALNSHWSLWAVWMRWEWRSI